jgi:RNA polymerase sigma-70 factor, ECF subfamily
MMVIVSHRPRQPPAPTTSSPQWLDEAYRQIDPALRRYLAAVAGARGEDLASQVWVDATAASRRFHGDVAAFRRLVFTIARRRVVDHRRRWWQWKVVLLADLPDGADDGGWDGSSEATLALIRTLPKAQAEVVFLRVLAGLSASDVAEIAGRSAQAVRVMQHRALTALAATLNAEQAEPR